MCFTQWYQKYIIRKYNCSDFSFISLYNGTQCTFNTYYEYIDSNLDLFDGNFINKNCISLCPLECDQTLYKTSISSNILNGYNYLSSIKNNSNLSKDFINRTLDL